MGDRTYYSLAFDATDLDLQLVTDIVEAFYRETAYDVEETLAESPDGLVRFSIEERYVGESREAADAIFEVLVKHDRFVEFEVTEDPKYEWLGNRVQYHPVHGFHESDCDADGRTVISEGKVRMAIQDTDTREGLVEALNALIGTKWNEPIPA